MKPARSQEQPLISVVVPVFNSRKYVAAAIESILQQTHTHLEIIAVDDGSTDGSLQILQELAARDSRVKPISIEHGGIARARNAGIAEAKGSLIAFLDHDDLALPQRFETQLAWLRQHNLDICGSCARRFDGDNALLWFPESQEATCYEMLFRCALLLPTVLMKAEILKAHPFDEKVAFEDYELWTRLCVRYRTGNVLQILTQYRTHARQHHVLESRAFEADLLRFQRTFVRELFPEATAQDVQILSTLAAKESLGSLRELENAGQWLLRLSQTSDAFLRQKMQARWWSACRRSVHLGPGVYRCYQKYAGQFELPINERPLSLWLACLLRRDPGRRMNTLMELAGRRMRRKHHAAA